MDGSADANSRDSHVLGVGRVVGIAISHGLAGETGLMAIDLLVALGWVGVCAACAAVHHAQVQLDEAREKIRAIVRREP